VEEGRPYIGDVISATELATMRVQGGGKLRAWADIGQELGYSKQAVCRYGHKVLKPALWGSYGTVKAMIEAADDGTLTAAELAQQLGCSPSSVLNYRRAQGEDRGGCSRCGSLGDEDKNPLTPTGRCLWCEMELQGIVLHKAVDSGLMAEMVEAVKVAMAGASDG